MLLHRKVVVLCTIFSWTLAAQMMMPAGAAPSSSSDKKKKELRDPIKARSEPIAKMDDETQEALKRSGQAGVLQAAQAVPDHIYMIQIRGTKKVEPDAVLVQLKTHIGGLVKREDIQDDIKRIFSMGLFTDVVVNSDKGPDNSIVLTYDVTEKPTIYKIKIEGNDAISEDDIESAIDLKSYHVADISRIRDNVEKIRKLYADKGYFLAHVNYDITPTKAEDMLSGDIETSKGFDNRKSVKVSSARVVAPDFVNVTFRIQEESKVRIEKIAFIGNEHLSNDEIKAYMRSKENHPLGMITSWGTYNEEMFDVDLLLIEQLYQNHGYLNVQVSKPRITLSGDKTRLSIEIPISEGEQFRIGEFSIDGDLVVDEKTDDLSFLRRELESRVSLKSGDVFNRTQLMQEIMSIADEYRNEGYAYVNLVPETRIHDEERLVDLNVKIESGPQVYFERIDIVGNSKTVDDVIRRELRIDEGEMYSSSLMRLSEMRVNQLGYFETVKFETKPGTKPDQMILQIEVKEKRTGSVQVGGGYGTGGEGFLLQGQIMQNNLFGRGQNLTGTVQWSGLRRIFDLRFIDPYLVYVGENPLTFSASLFNTQRILGDYARGSTGGDLMLGYPVGAWIKGLTRAWMRESSAAAAPYIPDFENFRFFLSYNIERVRISDNSQGILFDALHAMQPRYTTSIKPTLQLDQRNNRMFPSAGYFLEFRSEFATRYLGSGLMASTEEELLKRLQREGIYGGRVAYEDHAVANEFVRYNVNTRAYYNFDRWFFLSGWVLKFNLDFGILDTFGVPIVAENYRLGGIGIGNVSGLRGYYFQSIGPVANIAREHNNKETFPFVFGGNKQMVFNVELEFPIVKSMNFSGVLFFDMGNVFGYDQHFFYVGGNRPPNWTDYTDTLGTFKNLGLFSSAGFGIRWFSPFGPLRFEWGFPFVRRPAGTPGMPAGDGVVQFEFNIGTSF